MDFKKKLKIKALKIRFTLLLGVLGLVISFYTFQFQNYGLSLNQVILKQFIGILGTGISIDIFRNDENTSIKKIVLGSTVLGLFLGTRNLLVMPYAFRNLIEFPGTVSIYVWTGIFIWSIYIEFKDIKNREYLRVLGILFLQATALIFGIFIMLLSVSVGGCQAIAPYTAQDMDTGECKVFDYGGCGPKPHPYYFEEGCTSESANEMCQQYQKGSSIDYRERFCKNGTATELATTS